MTSAGSFALDTTTPHTARHWQGAHGRPQTLALLCEEPLSIRIQGKPYAVVMRTPGEEIAHAAGFCLAEGIVDRVEDIATVAVCEADNTNVVTVTLTPSRNILATDTLQRRSYISQTSCGICGKEVVADLVRELPPVRREAVFAMTAVEEVLDDLSRLQPVRGRTRSSHAVALYGADLGLMAAAEDVGRHNALDKAIGGLFLAGTLDRVMLGVLSSRISYEMVQKAARAAIPILVAKSMPTALAVSLASALNMTLACKAKGGGILVFCGDQRLDGTR